MKFAYQTITVAVAASSGFDPDDAAQSGRLDITDFGPAGKATWSLFVPVVRCSWKLVDESQQIGSIDLRFVDPDSDSELVILTDDSGTTTSFVTPGDFPGYIVPPRQGKARSYELHLRTNASGDTGQVWTVELWWEPRFPSQRFAELFCRLADGLQALLKKLGV